MNDGSIINGFLTLGVIVLALGAILLIVKKFVKKSGKFSGGMNINVISKISLQPKTHLFVVKIAEKTLLIGATEHNINALADLSGGENENSYLPVGKAAAQNNQKTNSLPPKRALSQTNLSKTNELPFDDNSLSFGSFLKSAFRKQVN